VCLVTSRRRLAPEARTLDDELRALDRWLDEALGRVDLVQIREPDVDARRLTDLVARVVARARGTRTAVLVNDRADVARAAGADGVHVPAAGAPVARVRSCGPAGWIVGRAVHGFQEAQAEPTADYLLFGTVFPSASKGQGAPVQGAARLAEVVAGTSVPVLAIGGLDPGGATQCRAAGAAGVAAIGLFLPPGREAGSLGVSAAAAALRDALRDT
jgi:thiamine-phosphate pyrophosphorylase